MAHLVIQKNALAHNLRMVQARCKKLGASFMLVFKEAGVRPELLRYMQDTGFADRVGLCHFPSDPIAAANDAPALKIPAHLLYMVAGDALPAAVARYDVLYQTSEASLQALAQEARRQNRNVPVVLPVEMGDGRDGVRPEDIPAIAKLVRTLAPHVSLWGLAANFACISDTPPNRTGLAALVALGEQVQRETGLPMPHISVGGSDILELSERESLPSGITEIRCGTAIYLGHYPLSGRPVADLRTDVVRLCGQVVECSRKNGRLRAIFNFGGTDTNPELVTPPHEGMEFVGYSSGYTIFDVTDCPHTFCYGNASLFVLHHRSLARALASPRLPLHME